MNNWMIIIITIIIGYNSIESMAKAGEFFSETTGFMIAIQDQALV
jgi:hypothetical protein